VQSDKEASQNARLSQRTERLLRMATKLPDIRLVRDQ
jgi:hypothetical protein